MPETPGLPRWVILHSRCGLFLSLFSGEYPLVAETTVEETPCQCFHLDAAQPACEPNFPKHVETLHDSTDPVNFLW